MVVLIFGSIVFVSLCVGVSAMSLSAFAVSRKKVLACFSVFVLAYAGERSLMSLGEFFGYNLSLGPSIFNGSENFLPHVLVGIALCQSLWLVVLYFFDEAHRRLVCIPPLVMFLISFAIAMAPIEEPVRKWGVCSMRQAALLCMAVYCVTRYFAADSEAIRIRCKRRALPFFVLTALTTLAFVENTWAMLFLDPPASGNGYVLEHLYRCNISESLFFAFVLAVTVRLSLQTLLLRRDEISCSVVSRKHLEDVLPYFARKYNLSNREQEIVAYMISGETNDWIARELQVSIGTVKTHTHHIFKKTGASNRKELNVIFWSN